MRINAYEPGASSPCLECAWDDRSYDLLEQEYSCTGGEITVPATGTPVELGALAAALQAGELRRLLDDTAKDNSLVSAQLMLDTTTHTRHLSRFTHNEHCRFDHEIWKVETVALSPPDNTLADLFDAVDAGSDPSISLEGHAFATHVDCVACGRRSNVGLSLYGRLSDGDRTCSCGGRMFAPGFFSLAAIRRSDLSTVNLGLKLAALGFCDSDVVSVANGSDETRHFEIGQRVVQ